MSKMVEVNNCENAKEFLRLCDSELFNMSEFLNELQNGNPKRKLAHKTIESLKEARINLRALIKEL